MTMSSIAEYLANTLSANQQQRAEAQQKLEQLEKDNFPMFMGLLAQELCNEGNQEIVRSSSGLMLKNALTAKDPSVRDQYAQRWLTVDGNTRIQIKGLIFQALSAANIRCGVVAAQAIAAVASIELPTQQWPDLIKGLLQNVSTGQTTTKQASLQAIGFICESIDPDILATQANEILTAVAQGARKEEPSDQVRLAAIQALYNSLEFIRGNFEQEGERNYIMQIVCEATQSTLPELQVAAYECLVRIMSLYYDKMHFYMEKALFGLTIMGMKHDNEKVALQAVEFWSTVCEEEIELALEAEEARDMGISPEGHCFRFAESAAPQLIPVLLWLLTRKEEDDDEDEWNISMSAATSLGLLANAIGDVVVSPVLGFVEGNIQNVDWKFREAAVMAFGSILEGPDPKVLAGLAQTALPVLINMINDSVVQVKDTTAWSLGRICELLPETAFQQITPLMQALMVGINDSPRVASNCAWALINLSEQEPSEGEEKETYSLSPYFETVVTTLMNVAEKPGQEPNFRASAYEAMASFVSSCAKDCFPTVEKLTMAILDRLTRSIEEQRSQVVSGDDLRTILELQSNICSVLTSVVRRMSSQIQPLADRIMHDLLLIMSSASKSSTVMEDAFLTVGALSTAVEGEFLRYMDSFQTFLLNALQNHEEHAMCSIAVGIVGDLCRALNDQMAPHASVIMTQLVNTLQSPVLHRNVKPVILSCFGDIALAIGSQFEPYLGFTMQILHQASLSEIDIGHDYTLLEYQNALYEGIVEAYVGIVQGLKAGDKVALLAPHIENMFGFLERLSRDENRTEAMTRAALGLLGDVAEAFPPGQLKPLYSNSWIDPMLKEARARKYATHTREVAKWSKEMMKKQVS